MGLFNYFSEKNKANAEREKKSREEEAARLLLEKQIAEEEAERQRIIELDNQLTRDANIKLRENDDERFALGALWLLNNQACILKASVTKIGKQTRDYEYWIPDDIAVGDLACLDDSNEIDDNGRDISKTVVSHRSLEIGELSKSTREKLENYDIDDLYAVVSKIVDEDDMKITLNLYDSPKNGEPGYRQIRTYIAGTKFINKDGSSRQECLSKLSSGKRIKLIFGYYNNEPAIMVCNSRDFQLGYIPAELVPEIYKHFRNNKIGGVYIDKLIQKDGIIYSDIVINIARF